MKLPAILVFAAALALGSRGADNPFVPGKDMELPALGIKMLWIAPGTYASEIVKIDLAYYPATGWFGGHDVIFKKTVVIKEGFWISQTPVLARPYFIFLNSMGKLGLNYSPNNIVPEFGHGIDYTEDFNHGDVLYHLEPKDQEKPVHGITVGAAELFGDWTRLYTLAIVNYIDNAMCKEGVSLEMGLPSIHQLEWAYRSRPELQKAALLSDDTREFCVRGDDFDWHEISFPPGDDVNAVDATEYLDIQTKEGKVKFSVQPESRSYSGSDNEFRLIAFLKMRPSVSPVQSVLIDVKPLPSPPGKH